MSELEIMRLYKADAMEALADNERVIKGQRKRITELELHLAKLRDLIWLGYCNTNGVLPMEYAHDVNAKVRKATKKAEKKITI